MALRPFRPQDLRARVEGKLAVVTGASRGIGREVARRIAVSGATVVGLARDGAALDAVRAAAARAGGTIHPLLADLRATEAAIEAAKAMLAEWGVPDLVVSNAGHSIHRPVSQSWDRLHDFERLIRLHYLGPLALLAPLAARMRAGQIVSVTSAAIDWPVPNWSAYTASKAAFEAWLASAGPELGAQGVTVTSVHLPRVATSMSAPTAGRYLVPELTVSQAATVVCQVIAHPRRTASPWWARLGAGLNGAWPELGHQLWLRLLRSGLEP
jgi:NAD(P)-dependent dehydrogenase (short-subunit alcohol dehydrogenase family)